MYNCRNQETIITVIPTSRHGFQYDTVRVEALFQLDQALQPQDNLMVPNLQNVPPHLLEMLRASQVTISPMPQSYIEQAILDFGQETSDPNRAQESLEDAMIGLLKLYMYPVPVTQIGTDYYYRVSYEYFLHPDNDGSFNIKATVPFKGLNLPAGEIRLTVTLPPNVTVDRDATKGIDVNNEVIEEEEARLAGNKPVIGFYRKVDPNFFIKYRY